MIKKCCLLLLAMAPIASVAFAAKSALNIAQIRNGIASDTLLADGGPQSIIKPPQKST